MPNCLIRPERVVSDAFLKIAMMTQGPVGLAAISINARGLGRSAGC
jgi:hypothetical protein